MQKVCWYMTEKCNLSCDFCYAFKNNHHPRSRDLIDIGNHIKNQGINTVHLTGGEPLLNISTYEVINTFNKSIDLSLTTNGTIFPKNEFQKNTLQKLNKLCVSVDAVTDEYFYLMRGRNNNCDVTIILDNLMKYMELGINVEINTVITKKNVSHVSSIADYLLKHCKNIVWRIFDMAVNENVDFFPQTISFQRMNIIKQLRN